MHQPEFAGNNEHTVRMPIDRHLGRIGLVNAFPAGRFDEKGRPVMLHAYTNEKGQEIIIKRHVRGSRPGPGNVPIVENVEISAAQHERDIIKQTRDEVLRKHQGIVNKHKARQMAFDAKLKQEAAQSSGPDVLSQPHNVSANPSSGDSVRSKAFDYNQPPVSGFGPEKGATQEFLNQQAAQQPEYSTGGRRLTEAEIGDDYGEDYDDPRLGLTPASGYHDAVLGEAAKEKKTPAATEPDVEAPWQPNEDVVASPSDRDRQVDDTFEANTYGVKPVAGRGAAIPGPQQTPKVEQGTIENRIGGAAAAEAANKEAQVDEAFQTTEATADGGETREVRWGTISPTARKQKTFHEPTAFGSGQNQGGGYVTPPSNDG